MSHYVVNERRVQIEHAVETIGSVHYKDPDCISSKHKDTLGKANHWSSGCANSVKRQKML